MKRRRVRLFEWLTLLPVAGPLPQISQRWDMMLLRIVGLERLGELVGYRRLRRSAEQAGRPTALDVPRDRAATGHDNTSPSRRLMGEE
jgi:hypothetical protein